MKRYYLVRTTIVTSCSIGSFKGYSWDYSVIKSNLVIPSDIKFNYVDSKTQEELDNKIELFRSIENLSPEDERLSMFYVPEKLQDYVQVEEYEEYLEIDRDTYYDYDSRISQYDSMKHEFNKIIK